jgi:hypothetical protein
MVNPDPRFGFPTSTVVDCFCVVHYRQGSCWRVGKIWGETLLRRFPFWQRPDVPISSICSVETTLLNQTAQVILWFGSFAFPDPRLILGMWKEIGFSSTKMLAIK